MRRSAGGPRPSRARFGTTVGSVKGRRKGNQSLCQFETDDPDQTVLQFGFAKYAMPPGFDGGHLIALDIGGIENPANVVPMPSFFNRLGTWREQEQFLLQVLSGRSVRLKVEVQYTGAGPIPSKLKLTYSYPCPTDEDPSLLSVNTLELAGWVYSRTGYTIPEDIYRQFTDYVSDYCVELGKNTDEHDLPYSFLDWLNEELDHAIIGSSSIANGAKFTKLQRQYVWSLNCWNNNAVAQQGFLVSDIDDGSDQYKDLSTKGCLEFPQVNHMKPASKGGTNAFDNCQLTSSWYNNKKRADYSRTDADWKEFDDARKKRSVRARSSSNGPRSTSTRRSPTIRRSKRQRPSSAVPTGETHDRVGDPASRNLPTGNPRRRTSRQAAHHQASSISNRLTDAGGKMQRSSSPRRLRRLAAGITASGLSNVLWAFRVGVGQDGPPDLTRPRPP